MAAPLRCEDVMDLPCVAGRTVGWRLAQNHVPAPGYGREPWTGSPSNRTNPPATPALIQPGDQRKLAAKFMSNVPSDRKYAKSHEWVQVAGDTGVVGITDHAQQELTDIVFVELPAVGRKVKAGEACAVVESVKTASDIYSPVSGEIVAANAAVVDNPALVNTDAQAGGWLFKIKLSAPAELNSLLSPADYQKQIGG